MTKTNTTATVDKAEKKVRTPKVAKFDAQLINQLSSLEPDQLALLPDGLKSLYEQHVDALAKASKKGKVVKTAKASVELYKPDSSLLEDDFTMLVNLGDIVHLDAVKDIPNSRMAMRVTNADHVAHMRATLDAGGMLPPMKVQLSSVGPILIDGYHRESAYLGELNDTITSDDVDASEELKRLVASMPIKVVPIDNTSVTELIRQTFESNRQNGMPMSRGSLATYAIWLMETDGIGRNEAARYLGISPAGITQQIARNKEKLTKMIDTLPEDEQAEIALTAQESDNNQDGKNIEVALRKILTGMKTLGEITDSEDVLVELFVPAINADQLNVINLMCSAMYRASIEKLEKNQRY